MPAGESVWRRLLVYVLLTPKVPNRYVHRWTGGCQVLMYQSLNYILWLQDLLDTTAEDFRDAFDPAREVVGLDMCVCPNLSGTHVLTMRRGTGASAIYPLLGCSQRPKWIFAGTGW